jgi:hypothetical protein
MVGSKAFYTSFGHMMKQFVKEFGREKFAEENFQRHDG